MKEYEVLCIKVSGNNRCSLTPGKVYKLDEEGLHTDDYIWRAFLAHSGNNPMERWFNFCEIVNKAKGSDHLIFKRISRYRRF
jgi:hypothetical protein